MHSFLSLYAYADQYRNDHQIDAGYRYSSAIYQLWRHFPAVFQRDALHIPGADQTRKEIFLNYFVSLCSSSSLGGGMVDTRDLEMLFEIIICNAGNY